MTRVGVTASSPNDAAEYLRALELAGAQPFVLLQAAEIGECDGLLFTGGYDVDPARYGAQPHSSTRVAAAQRDELEIELMGVARKRSIPVLAICRGLQVANVAFGGTLVQDIPDLLGTALAHGPAESGKPLRGVLAGHVVTVESDCALASITGVTQFATGSRHHQAVDRVAPDVRVVARTPDGVIEALEARFPSPFWLAVQWHPESTLDDGGPSRALFDRFVRAAAGHS